VSRRTVLPLLFVLALAPIGVCGPPGSRFASLVSRDSRMYLWTDDRAAFLRRARRVGLIEELSRIAPPSLSSDLAAAGSDLSVFLAPDLLEALPAVARRGSGELALSVEGYVLERGRASPDILVLADATGFEGLVELISMLVDQPERAELLAPLRLPFRLNTKVPVRTHVHRGVAIVQFETAGGQSMALAETGGVLYGARSSQRVEMALDRALRQALGSLADSDRFQEVFRRLAPSPGSLFWYTDLRRLRDPRSVRLLRESAGKDLLVETLSAYDGIGLTLRGHGGTFEFRAFLERAAGSRSRPHPWLRPNAPLLSPVRLPKGSVAAVSLRADAAQAGTLLSSMNQMLGGAWVPNVLRDYCLAVLGEEAAAEIGARLTGEFTVVVPDGVHPGEVLPRLVFLMQTGDAPGLRRWLSGVARRSSPASFRQVALGADTYFLMPLPGNGYQTELALMVEDGWLMASTRIVHLRWFVNLCRMQSAGLSRTERFLRPMDRLDFQTGQPVSGLLFGAGPELAEGVGSWLGSGLRFHPHFGLDSARTRFAARCVRLLLDPDLTASFQGLAVRCQSTEDGVLIDGVGP